MRPFQKTAVMLTVVTFAIATFALTDANTTGNSAGTACVFTDGKQMSVRYDAAPVNPQKFHKGEIWTPGSSPMYLFTQTDITLSGSTIPAGAYSLYVIPADKEWTLVVNKNLKDTAKYDPSQDLVRAKMDLGTLPSEDQKVKVLFGHIADKQCSMRIYRAKLGGFVEFKEQ
jgi:Protein of unknown function (DUF2911)